MAKSVAEKIGVKANMRAIFINAPGDAIEAIDTDGIDLKKRLSGKFDYIHLFVRNQTGFQKDFPRMMTYLKDSGMLWVSWPKSKQEETDLTIKTVIKSGYDYGLVESKAISINDIWSALKFTWPKDNVQYNNSYGKLKQS